MEGVAERFQKGRGGIGQSRPASGASACWSLIRKYAISTPSVLILDASALITLAGADGLDLLAFSPRKACTVREVHREAVELGGEKGRPDAGPIGRVFDSGVLAIRAPIQREKIPGISQTDSLLIHLAKEISGAALLTNDRNLFRKAEQRGLEAMLSAQFVQRLYEAATITLTRRDTLLQAFVDHGRYSPEFMQAFLLGR